MKPLQKLLRLPLKAIPKGTAMPVLSGMNRGMRWRVDALTHGCWLGTYEREKQRILRSVLTPNCTFIDVGAHAGFYTLAASRIASHVWAIEPNPRNLSYLRSHIAMNGITNVTVIEGAVSDQAGTANFDPMLHSTSGRLRDTGSLAVPTIRLDSLPMPDVVKIDIEDGEVEALRSAEAWIAARHTVFLVDLDNLETRDEARSLLRGYRIEEFALGEIVAHPLATRLS